MFDFSTVVAGESIPPLVIPPLSRHTLALYCGGSGDHHPIHTDIDYAREEGFGDVIAHGMLSMAYVGRFLTDMVAPEKIVRFETRFRKIVRVGDELTCGATVASREQLGNQDLLTLDVFATTANGDVAVEGNAVINLS